MKILAKRKQITVAAQHPYNFHYAISSLDELLVTTGARAP